MLTGTSAIPKSLAMGASCAVAIKPPAAIMTNIAYITQNAGVATFAADCDRRRMAVAAVAPDVLGQGLRGLPQQPAERKHHQPLAQPEIEKRRLIAAAP